MAFDDPLFWTALLKIIGVNVVLSGDNAVVIALAARSLPHRQQRQAIFWGAGAAIALRIVLTLFAVALLALPYLKLTGSALLLWIGVRLLVPEDGEPGVTAGDNLATAIRTILVADLVMSLDNVIAVAAAAGGSLALLVIGLAISIPLVIFGATLLVKVMDRFPVIVTVGAALIGFVAGEMAWEDAAISAWTAPYPAAMKYLPATICALLVVAWGQWLARRHGERHGAVRETPAN
ncbi:MAG: TerC family protein [Usitatibacter sp.]